MVIVKIFFKAYDSCELLKAYKGATAPILVDQGSDDQFLKANQLLPESLAQAAKENSSVDLKLRYHEVRISRHFKTSLFYLVRS